jgi:polyphosphate kinase
VTDVAEPTAVPNLEDPQLYFNRELSWLEFNARVLELAEDDDVRLLERVKFCAIYASNLDEFFMVRVAGVHDQVDAGIDKPGQDGTRPQALLGAIRATVHGLNDRLTRCFERDLRPALAEEGIRIVGVKDVTDAERRDLASRFRRQIFPVLTPLAVGLGRPFPYISNLSLSLGIIVRDPTNGQEIFARVKVPKEMLPRFMTIGDGCTFVPLEELIAEHLDQLFPGMEIVDYDMFRVTRDADFTVSDEADDLLRAVEAELRRRRFGEVVRVELDASMPAGLREALTTALGVEPRQVYEIEGMLDLEDLWAVVKLPGFDELRDSPWTPVTQPRLQPGEDGKGDVLGAMRRGDVLVHHPYDSFSTSVERFVEQAVADPDVLAIKMTVYRTSDDSPLVPALIRATERGKQAVCLVELKARFDERANITWARAPGGGRGARRLRPPRAQDHTKCLLVVRRRATACATTSTSGRATTTPRPRGLHRLRALHVRRRTSATTSPTSSTSSRASPAARYRKAAGAPTTCARGSRGDRSPSAATRRAAPRDPMKMNSLVDPSASGPSTPRLAGPACPIELTCAGSAASCRGGGVSENIRVVSIVGRFLEHSRIFAFEREDDCTVYIGSADLMPRNLDTRVELLTPIADDKLRADLLDTLERCFADDTNTWELGRTATGRAGRRATSLVRCRRS